MPIVRTIDAAQRGESRSGFPLSVPNSFRPIAIAIASSATLAFICCDPPSALARAEKPKPRADAQSSSSPIKDDRKKPRSREGYAVWYVVPANSLASRRANKGEFTAAHNRLPLGSMVRVTHLKNGKSVIVRITDRGVTQRGAIIDLCKPAAEKLGIIHEGRARVRLEEVPAEAVTTGAPDRKAAAANP